MAQKLNAKQEAQYLFDRLKQGAGSILGKAKPYVQQAANIYQKVSPYVPFAPQIPPPPKQIQKNYQNVVKTIKSVSQQVVSQGKGLWQGLQEVPTAPYTNRTSGYSIGRAISGGALIPMGIPSQVSKVPSLIARGVQEWGPYSELYRKRAENTENYIKSNPQLKKNPQLAQAVRVGDQFLTMGILSGIPSGSRNLITEAGAPYRGKLEGKGLFELNIHDKNTGNILRTSIYKTTADLRNAMGRIVLKDNEIGIPRDITPEGMNIGLQNKPIGGSKAILEAQAKRVKGGVGKNIAVWYREPTGRGDFRLFKKGEFGSVEEAQKYIQAEKKAGASWKLYKIRDLEGKPLPSVEGGVGGVNVPPDLQPKQTILKKIEELKKSVIEQKFEGQVTRDIIKTKLENYSEEDLRDLASFKKMAFSKAGQEGDVVTLYNKNPRLTSKVLEKVKEVSREYEQGLNMTDEEAYRLALDMPTKSEMVIPRPKEYGEIKQLQEKAKNTYDLVYHNEPKPKSEDVIQSNLKLDKEWTQEVFRDAVGKEKNTLNENIDTIVGSIKKSFDDVEVTPSQKIGILDYLRTPDRVLKKIGLENEANLLRQKYDNYLKELPIEINRVTAWSKRVTNEGNKRIFQYLDGKNVNLQGEEIKVVQEIKGYLSQWAERLKLPQDKRISHYITHIFEKDFIKKEFDPELAKLIRDKVAGSVYDPFLEKRLGKMGYREDTWAALDAYIKRATRKANMDIALERIKSRSKMLEVSQYNYIKKYVDNINLRPSDLDNLIDNTIKSVAGYKFGQRPTAFLTRTGRQAVYRGALGLNVGIAVKNLTQGVNTYAKLGEKYTLKGYWDILTKGSEELDKVGILKQDLIQDRTLNSTKKVWEYFDKGLFYFFETAEKINRGSAYFGAKAKALAQGLNETQAIEYAKKLVRDTQFTFGSIDTPVVLQSDVAKLLAQFQTYSLKQVEFLGEMVRNKEVSGLLRYALGTLAIASTLGKLIGMEWKDFIPSFRIGAPPTLATPVEMGKSLLGVPDRYGNVPDLQERGENIGRTLLPYIPAGVQLRKTIGGLSAVNKGLAESKSGRIQYAIEKTPSAYLKAGIFGKSNLPEAKEYFNKKLQPLGEKQSEQIRQKGYEDYKQLRDIQEKVQPYQVTPEEKQAKKEKGQMLLNMLKTQGVDATDQYLKQALQSGEITKQDIKKMISDYRAEKKKQMTGTTISDEYLLNQPVVVRARYLNSLLRSKSNEERNKLVIDFRRKGIMTTDVIREMVNSLHQ